MTTVIAFMGPAGSGKTTAARFVGENYRGARMYALARPLKEMARAIWDFSDAQLYGTQAEKEAVDPRWNMSPRVALQKLGTDAIRTHLGPQVWTDICLRQIVKDAPRIAVIEDCRFANEAHAIRNPGPDEGGRFGRVIRLDCPDRISSAGSTHPSEREWEEAPYDLALSVRRSVPDLQAAVERALTSLGISRG